MVPRPELNSNAKRLNQDNPLKPPRSPPFSGKRKDMKDMDSKSLIAGIVIGLVIGLILGILLEASLFIV